MAGRVKIKSKVVKSTLENKDVIDMFQGVLGTSGEGSATLSIAHPKYVRIMEQSERFIKTISMFSVSRIITLFPDAQQGLAVYLSALKSQHAESFKAPDLDLYVKKRSELEVTMDVPKDYTDVPPAIAVEFQKVFNKIKTCNIINMILVTCKNLVRHKKHIMHSEQLKGDFILRIAGNKLCPLPDLPEVNFRTMYIDDRLTPQDKNFLLLILNKLYTVSHDVYEAVSAPDIDVKEFVKVIMSSIGEIKKQIPRCEQAFQKIIDSVGLLQNNFDGYYKDFVASNNPTIIMENFVIDVSKSTNASPKVTAQFRQIIGYYRKIASQQASNPKLQSLFKQVDKNFQELEKNTKEGSESESESESDIEEVDTGESQVPEAKAPETVVKKPNASKYRRKKEARARKNAAKKAEESKKSESLDATSTEKLKSDDKSKDDSKDESEYTSDSDEDDSGETPTVEPTVSTPVEPIVPTVEPTVETPVEPTVE